MYRMTLQIHMSKMIYAALLVSGLLLFVGGGIGSAISVKLQCNRGNERIEKAWKATTASALVGVLGTIVLLAIQGFTRRSSLRDTALKILK